MAAIRRRYRFRGSLLAGAAAAARAADGLGSAGGERGAAGANGATAGTGAEGPSDPWRSEERSLDGFERDCGREHVLRQCGP